MVQIRDDIMAMLKERGYLRENENTWEDMARRVAKALASAEEPQDQERYETEFYELLANQKFVNSTPTLMNAEVGNMGGLSSCFIIDIKDDLAKIHEAMGKCAKIYQYNGGVGFDISPLRPAKAPLGTARGFAGGPVAFMSEFNEGARVATLYNERKSATKVDMQVWHPDIHAFIHCKDDGKSLTLMNISVSISDAFMEAVKNDGDWDLVFPDFEWNKEIYNAEWDGDLAKWKEKGYPVKLYETLKARDLFRELCESAWLRGDPGISFYDHLNLRNPNKHVGRVGGTNPCFTGDMRILTVDGYKTFSELEGKTDIQFANVFGFSSNGRVWCSGEKQVIELRFKDGSSVRCTPDHVFLAYMRARGTEHDWYDTYECQAKDLVGETLVPYLPEYTTRAAYEVESIADVGVERVYDFSEPETHWGVVEGKIAHNCAEFNSLPYTSCCLGSFNLMAYVKDSEFDISTLLNDVPTAVRMLDNVITLNKFPLPEIQTMTQKNRSIGIGAMGLADLLYALKIPYGSPDAIHFTSWLFGCINAAAKRASHYLTYERGPYENWKGSVYSGNEYPVRNSDFTSIAPTGSISTICGVSSSIEPNFGLVYERHTADNRTFYLVNPIFKGALEKAGIYSDELLKKVSENGGSCVGIPEVPEDMQILFVTTHDLTPKQHIDMCAAVQDQISLSVSKTVNLPHDATVDDVADAYLWAFDAGLLGITVYRDGSRDSQVLTTGPSNGESAEAGDALNEDTEYEWGYVIPSGDNKIGLRRKLRTGCGTVHFQCFFDMDTGRLTDIYADRGGRGGCTALLSTVSRLLSRALRLGDDPEKISQELQETLTCSSYSQRRGAGQEVSPGFSCASAMGKALIEMNNEFKNTIFPHVQGGRVKTEAVQDNANAVPHEDPTRLCPKCHEPLANDGGCVTCVSCGWSKCG